MLMTLSCQQQVRKNYRKLDIVVEESGWGKGIILRLNRKTDCTIKSIVLIWDKHINSSTYLDIHEIAVDLKIESLNKM